MPPYMPRHRLRSIQNRFNLTPSRFRTDAAPAPRVRWIKVCARPAGSLGSSDSRRDNHPEMPDSGSEYASHQDLGTATKQSCGRK